MMEASNTADRAPDRFEFVDPHVHFWDHGVSGLRWPYLEKGFEHPRLKNMHRLQAPQFTITELRAQAPSINIMKVVHVQSAQEKRYGIETKWIEGMAELCGTPHAIVARVPIASPDLNRALRENHSSGRFRGVRDMTAQESIGTDEFAAGFKRIVTQDLNVELLVPYIHHPDVAELAMSRPEATVIIGHAGLAERRDSKYFSAWSKSIERLAKTPNIVIKISALASGADPEWTVDSIRPWVLHCIEHFGPKRSMFASNWPVDRLYGTYEQLLEAYLEITSDLTCRDRRDLFVNTATTVYRMQ